MSNPIKFDTLSSPSGQNIITRSYWFVGTASEQAYGPTSTTKYYNGYQIPPDGYVVYVNKVSGGPSNYVAASEDELAILTRRFGYSGATGMTDVYQYYNDQSNKILLVNKDYENFPPGMNANLDFSYIPSYPRSGTTVNDITRYATKYNGTLQGAYKYYFDYTGGYMDFNGTNTRVSFSTITPGVNIAGAVIIIARPARGDTGYGTLLSNSSGGPVSTAFGVVDNTMSYNYYDQNGWNILRGNSSLIFPAYYHFAWVKDGSDNMTLYVNGFADSESTPATTTNGGPVNSLGSNWTTYFEGRISKFHYYENNDFTARLVKNHFYMGDIFAGDANYDIRPSYAYDVGNPASNSISTATFDIANYVTSNGTMKFVYEGPSTTTSTGYGGSIFMNSGRVKTSNPVNANNAFTISFWFKYSTSISVNIFMYMYDSTGITLTAETTPSAKLKFSIKDSNTGTTATIQTTSNVADGVNWNHVVFSYTSIEQSSVYGEDYALAKGMYVYVNGTKEDGNDLSTLSPASWNLSDNLYIGGDNTTAYHNFTLGTVQMYSGFAFRQQEAIQNCYAHIFRYNT